MKGGRPLRPGYGCVPPADWLRLNGITVLPSGAHLWYKGDDGLFQGLEIISASTTTVGVFFMIFSG